MAVMGRASWQAWVDEYAESHRHPVNRVCHTVGIPMIAVSILLAPLSVVWIGFWRVPVALFVVGWIFQFAGHAFEKKPPEFFKDWRFLFVGLRWWFAKLRGRA
jgi:uncharacterized membrane protein YGL010W